MGSETGSVDKRQRCNDGTGEDADVPLAMSLDDEQAAAAASAAAAAAQCEDAEILRLEQEIREEAEAAPLVGAKAPLDQLKAQYASNPGFLPKIDSLCDRFGALRRTRPDGNCFYRAYVYGIFEHVAGKPELLSAFLDRAKGSLDYCLGAGYDKIAVEDPWEVFVAALETLGTPGASAAAVDELPADDWGYLVCWARCCTSAYLKRNAEDFLPYISSHGSIAEFCAQEVDPMAKDADHLQIKALSTYFGVPVCVVYLDQSQGDIAAEHREGGDATCPVPTVHLLYRPGHYDLIYPL